MKVVRTARSVVMHTLGWLLLAVPLVIVAVVAQDMGWRSAAIGFAALLALLWMLGMETSPRADAQRQLEVADHRRRIMQGRR